MIEFALEKKEEGPYWDRLLADKTKQHWLKIDFNKWKDEDESDEEGEGGQGGNLEEVSVLKLNVVFICRVIKYRVTRTVVLESVT